MGHLIFEINNSRRVDGYAEIACLEVEMGTGASACVAAERYRLACLDILVWFHEEAAEMAVDGLETVVMTDNHIVAIATTFIFREAYFAGERSPDSVADL